MHKHLLTLVLALYAWPASASTVPDIVKERIPSAQLVGSARMTYMMWDVYDAALYVPARSTTLAPPFALSLTYLREISARQIADRAIEEMRQQGHRNELQLAEWHSRMTGLFPNVGPGTNLTGMAMASGETMFFHDNQLLGVVPDAEFTSAFFNIWLGPRSSDEGMRTRLTSYISAKE